MADFCCAILGLKPVNTEHAVYHIASFPSEFYRCRREQEGGEVLSELGLDRCARATGNRARQEECEPGRPGVSVSSVCMCQCACHTAS